MPENRDIGKVFKINEAALQAAVIEMAKLYGWLVHHTRAVQLPSGRWATPIQGHAGFPDLVLVRDGETIFVELKSAIGRTSDWQDKWIAALQEAQQEVHIWRPKDITAIRQRLAR